MNHDVTSTPQSILKTRIQGLSDTPGIYRFYNQQHELLYVGKARNLKKRVSSYLRKKASTRISALISQIAHIEITITQTENDALLLESNLIKTLKPYYNVLLRDDKSYPYLVLSTHENYPRLYAYRGKPKGKEEYFGPYPSIIAMRESLNLLQKLFKLRSCRDTFFKNRVRPCLQYQINRCTAPCVGLISPEDYQTDVEKVRLFLRGKSAEVIQQLTQHMITASAQQEYEKAAHLLDKITYLRQIQQQQTIITPTTGNIDVIAWTTQAGLHCIHVLPIREGQIVGGQAYFPKVPGFLKKSAILSEFISQFYVETPQRLPEQIVVDTRIEHQTWLANALSTQHAMPITICHRPNKTQTQWLALAQQNAQQALEYEIRTQKYQQHQRQTLQKLLQLRHIPERIECFDISHTQGEATVAACVVFDTHGPCKRDYRRFNIKNITPGDDYAAMQQALQRRYATSDSDRLLPDILLIDGGKGQLTQAITILTKLQLKDKIHLIAIAKGPTRKPGDETLFLTEQKTPFILTSDDPALHLLQQIRDEAHRFAITGHRQQRAKQRQHSMLETIPGIGPTRRQKILTHFGGLHGLKRASLHELNQVPGINLNLAKTIYFTLKNHA
jgi:excinuclease ABC subunit C